MKALILAATLVVTGVQAQPFSILYTGQELLNRMSTNPSWSLGYVAGVADSMAGITICIPPSTVSLGQMHDMVKQTLEAIPSERHGRADVFIEYTLSRRWPCARRGQNL